MCLSVIDELLVAIHSVYTNLNIYSNVLYLYQSSLFSLNLSIDNFTNLLLA